MCDVLDGLDTDQRLVAETLDVPLVVLAGAGSGKTRAVTHRIAHAVRMGRYSPAATLAVTFTTRAAGEMKARLDRLGARGVQTRTIHSAALRQAQYFWPQAYGTALPPVRSATIPLVARAASGVLGRRDTALLRDLAGEISWAKSANVAPSDYPELAGAARRVVNGVPPEQVAAVLVAYERAKSADGVIDFADILLCTAALLADHPDIAMQVRTAYRHFVVDEYQDISAIQHTLLKLWVGDRRDLCVVGDPNQAIHSFAGARSDFLLRFRRDWPGAEQLELTRNYRSSPQVLALAAEVLGARSGVKLRAMREPGPEPRLVRYSTDVEEAAAVASWLVAQHASGTPWRELAVLYRINAQAPIFEASLTDAGVPYLVRGTDRFYERAEIRQALGLVRTHAASEPDAVPLPAIEALLTRAGWQPTAPAGQGAQRERWESLNSLFDLVRALVTENELGMAELADELAQRAAWQQPPVGEAVTLSTMHAAKGLEWAGVALAGVREGLVPFSMAESPAQLAEERRLLYVAITRARRDLTISWATQGGRGRSRFLGSRASDIVDDTSTQTRKRTSLQSRRCRVCGGSLSTGADRKLGRHESCPSSYDEDLFERLRAWRKDQAAAQSAPAFVVFTDATLVALAESAPTTREELLRVPGVGTVKADRYADGLLAILSDR